MSISRIFQATPLTLQQTVLLEAAASHHLGRVLRAKIGDEVTLFNGEGGEFGGRIVAIDKKGVTVQLLNFKPTECESPCPLYLAQGIARGEKMDFIIQKAVELGVHTIIPLITERTLQVKSAVLTKRETHWQNIIVSACEQSGRNHLPILAPAISLAKWLPTVPIAQRFILSPRALKPLPATLSATAGIILLIGPEGGFSEKEEAWALQYQFLPISLGPRVLRTETATIAALTVFQCRYGDMG